MKNDEGRMKKSARFALHFILHSPFFILPSPHA